MQIDHALTSQYRSSFETHSVKHPLAFVRDVYVSGKWREISSFIVWELLHELHLFSKDSYLTFTSSGPALLDRATYNGDVDTSNPITQAFAGIGLHAAHCDHNWKLVHLKGRDGVIGCCYPNVGDLCECDSEGSIRVAASFSEPIKAIFSSSSDTTFVCTLGAVYRRAASDQSFVRVLSLSSPRSFFRHNNGMTELPGGTLVIGEYGNVWNGRGWKNLALLYSSTDGGVTWRTSDIMRRHGANKHIHVVKNVSILNKLFVADGDNYKKLWVTDADDFDDADSAEWAVANRFHIQMGGYTSIVEGDGKVFCGTDYQGGTNFLVETRDGVNFQKRVIPDPYRRSPIDNMVLRYSRGGTEIWANLPYSTAQSRSLLMVSKDWGKSWNRVVEYSRDTHLLWLISTSSGSADEVYIAVEDVENGKRMVYIVGDEK